MTLSRPDRREKGEKEKVMGDPATALRCWALEMARSNQHLPSEAAARNLCSGQGRDIWAYVTKHVVTKEKVKNVRGNLRWSRSIERGAGAASSSSSDAREKRRLMELVLSLRSDVRDLDNAVDQEQQEMDERALKDVRGRIRDAKQRDLALKAFGLRVGRFRQRLQQEARRVGERVRVLGELRKKAHTHISLPHATSTAYGDACQRPVVLGDLQGACHRRFLFYKSLYDHPDISTASSRSKGTERNCLHQQWVTQVEGLLSNHPPNHILDSLRFLAQENTAGILQLLFTMNVTRDMEELRFCLTSSHLQDVSEPPPVLRSVDSLLQECWRDCELRAVLKLGAVKRQMAAQASLVTREREFGQLLQERYGQRPVLLQANREIFELQLGLADRKSQCQSLMEQARLINNSITTRNRELQTLEQKHQSIMDFQELVDEKQDLIRVLITANSAAKSHLAVTRAEVISFMVHDLRRHRDTIISLTDGLQNSLSREVKLFASVSLPCLDRRVVRGTRRVPAYTLSLNRMDSSLNSPHFYHRLKKTLSILLFKGPEHVLDEAAQRVMEVEDLQMMLERQKEALEALQKKEGTREDADTLTGLVWDQDLRCSQESIPAVWKNLERCRRALEFSREFQREVQDWWEQPARLLVPWVKVGSRDVRGWVQRWSRLGQGQAGDGPDPTLSTAPRP